MLKEIFTFLVLSQNCCMIEHMLHLLQATYYVGSYGIWGLHFLWVASCKEPCKTTTECSCLAYVFKINFSYQAEECISQEEECVKHCRERVEHLKEHADNRKSAVLLWKKKRLDRMIVDHCLRSGCYETAKMLAQDAQVEVRRQKANINF